MGYSLDSAEVVVRAARIPDVPTDVITTRVTSTEVAVSWVAPYNGGSPIYAYHIVMQTSDGVTFAEEPVFCDGTDSTIVSETQCVIENMQFRVEPFNLPWASHIYAKVLAINLVGSSAYSAVGNGAIILTTPYAPQNLAENYENSSTIVALVWEEGVDNGGTPVIDYRIMYAIENGSFTVLATGITVTAYTAESLSEGTTYSFKVQARNLEGFGEFSEVLTVTAAIVPETPDAPITQWTVDAVNIYWTEPETNGAAITSYTIEIRQSDQVTYSTELTNCDGSTQEIIDNQFCRIPVQFLKDAPFNLPWGESVFAKVTAFNHRGSSGTSEAGNGAIIVTRPDPPINLLEDTQYRTASTLGLTWEAAAENGGTPILDYRISKAVDGGAYQVLAATQQTNLLVYSLTPGTNYQFKV